MKVWMVPLMACLPFCLQAKDLGTYGDLWPVAEQSFLSLIKDRLGGLEKSGKLAELQQQFKDRVVEHTLRPTPVDGLRTDTVNHTGWYDPTFVVAQDLADQRGTVFARKGESINPLTRVPMTTTLYFLDADDPRQVTWMKAQKPPTLTWKVILVKGNIREASDALSARIYFDQNGHLTRQLGIEYIPARVVQDGLKLRIDSFAMEEAE